MRITIHERKIVSGSGQRRRLSETFAAWQPAGCLLNKWSEVNSCAYERECGAIYAFGGKSENVAFQENDS